MANINYYEPAKIADLLGDLELYKYQPSGMKGAILNRVSDMLSGAVDIVDPSNPFTLLMETTCVNTSFAVQEFATLAKKLYPRLANSESDLYLHMSDKDYLGRFAEPARANVWFNFVYADFKRLAVNPKVNDIPDTSRLCLQIPRMYTLSISTYVFTLLYPIVITEHSNGVIDVGYDTSVISEIDKLSTGLIKLNKITQFNNESWLRFSVPMLEVGVTATETAVEKSSLFKQSVAIPDGKLFYYVEVYHTVDSVWTPMVTTHTQEVYDIATPTACITVLQDTGEVIVYIPPVYIINNDVQGKVRIDLYTTSGAIDANFADYKTSDFSVEYAQVDKVRDLVETAAPIAVTGKLVYISEQVSGGKGRLSFDSLKAAVIDNSIGDRKLPITSKQLDYDISQQGFTLIKDTDVLNDRIYFFQKDVPLPLTKYPISKLDMDMSEYMATINEMLATDCVENTGKNRYLLPEGTIFLSDNSLLRMLTKDEAVAVSGVVDVDLLNELNNKTYLSTFYHYVIDTNFNETSLRAYDFSTANVDLINFDTLNSTVDFNVNTNGVLLVKTPTGFRLTVYTTATAVNQQYTTNAAVVYLVYTNDIGENFYTFKTATGTGDPLVYALDLDTKYDVDGDDMLYFTSFVNEGGKYVSLPVSLVSDFRLLYVIPSTLGVSASAYIPTAADIFIKKAPGISAGFTVPASEILTLRFGDALPYLNTRIRNVTDSPSYKRHAVNVPLTYDNDMYRPQVGGGENVFTENIVCVNDICEILSDKIHSYGDIVTDANGVVYKYRIGDIKLDQYGDPELETPVSLARHMTLLFADYRSKKCNALAYTNYLSYVKSTITKDITVKMAYVQDRLLENTQGFLIVPNTINQITINVNNTSDIIIAPTVQFKVNVYVTSKVFNDYDAKVNIDYTIIKNIDDYLKNKVLIKTELITKLYTNLKEFITSISIPKFITDGADYVVVKDAVNKLAIKKLLVRQSDGTYNLSEDVVINYVQVN